MDTLIPASSPLFSYTPCQSCSTGWTPSANASNHGLTTINPSVVQLNFTGTSITLNTTSSSIWTTALQINGTTQNNSMQATNLPWGTHIVTLDVTPPANNTSDDEWFKFDGATIGLGALVGAESSNGTTDDSAWRDWKVVLSPGWNMLEQGESNWINQTQMEIEENRSGDYYKNSVSWTEQAGANTTIQFDGSAVWVYGVTGPDSGMYSVAIDNTTIGTYNANSTVRSHGALMYQTSGLEDANHTLTLTNMAQGSRLFFDRLEYRSGLLAAPSVESIPLPSTSAAAATGGAGLSGGAIAGIAVGAAAGIALLAVLIWALFARRKIREAMSMETSQGLPPSPIKPNYSFWRWSGATGMTGQTGPSRPSNPPEPDRPFVPLREKNIPNLGTAMYRINTPSPPPGLPQPQHHAIPGTSFLKLSRSPKKAQPSFFTDDTVPPVPPRPEFDQDIGPSTHPIAEAHARKTNALNAALSDTTSPLSTLRDSFFPKISSHRLGKKGTNRSISVKTSREDDDLRPPTPGGILDGYFNRDSARSFGAMQSENGRLGPGWDKDESRLPSMGERNPRRFLGKIMGDGRPDSGDSSRQLSESGWR